MCLVDIIAEYEPSTPKSKFKIVGPTRNPKSVCRQPSLAPEAAPRPVHSVTCTSATSLRCPVPPECVGPGDWLLLRRQGWNGSGGGCGGGNENVNGRRRRYSSASSSMVSVRSFKEVKRKVSVLLGQVGGLEREKERRVVEKEVREEQARDGERERARERERLRVRVERESREREDARVRRALEKDIADRELERERRASERELREWETERRRERIRRRWEEERRWGGAERRGPWHGFEEAHRRW
ncbi:hypothetical protein MMC08_003408 [Hypocenomyce scalaris]|nr:hypothetical protein [Hypocenomyce scalaris]